MVVISGASEVSGRSTYDRTKELKEFDETKAGVKGLVDSGVAKVPRIFYNIPDVHLHFHEAESIQNHSHDQIPLKYKTQPNIPIIELKEFITDNKDSSLRKEVVDQIRKASETWSFFQVLNHGIPASVLEEMLQGIRWFFEQDTELKIRRDVKNRRVVYNIIFTLYSSPSANWIDNLYYIMSPLPLHPDELPLDVGIYLSNQFKGVFFFPVLH
ncbi:hypothetical protein NE237_014999 [Protea cynaroides]|uniref:Non-haem dioxygenase N-terminal domain-containing protein n=1 Tax=Protea cynaroides TaxID=273540 RepID=A0A9Q0KD03_9MAGN|nr:hypothetical protein NE237_014999 [Protea cynaroides]